MLVMSRREGQEIIIGDDIRVMLVRIEGDKVRIGVTAPKEMPVHRLEVWEAIQKEMRNSQDDK